MSKTKEAPQTKLRDFANIEWTGNEGTYENIMIGSILTLIDKVEKIGNILENLSDRLEIEESTTEISVSIPDVKMKHCNKCKTIKDLSDFYKDNSKAIGVRSSCKLCDNAARKDRRKTNKQAA